MSHTVESQFSGRKWHFTKDEIENHSPSRMDGIDLIYESHLRKLYCTFLQDIGIKLKVPQVTIASAMLLCHQFYMRQSHTKNDWQTVATGCIFLACKLEETPRYLNDVVVVAYEMINNWDPSAPRRIRQKEFFDRQKEVILVAERLLLSTIAFDLNIQLPYKPLVTALKRLKISPNNLAKVAWNFVNDWMRSTLCLRYKPHYIAAGSLFLAAKLQKVKLSVEKGRVWWQQFDVSLKQLEEVIQEMRTLLGQDKKPLPSLTDRSTGKMPSQTSSQSCISSLSVVDCYTSCEDLAEDKQSKQRLASDCSQNPVEGDNGTIMENASLSQTSNNSCGSISVVEDGDAEVQPTAVDSAEKPESKNLVAHHNCSNKIDISRIREAVKKRKREGVVKNLVEVIGVVEIDTDSWIEYELENGIEVLGNELVEKKQRKLLVL